MKLIRVGLPGEERPGVLAADGSRIDCSALGEDWDERFFGHGGLPRLAAWLETHGATAPRFDPTERLGSCVARPSKIICIGMNYRLHAKEIGAPEPTEPIIFLKATTALCGPNDDVMIPRGSQKTDWEVELAVVIGSTARYVSEVDAMCHVAGFALHNDYSEREYQMERGGQWVKGKSCDTFAPLGPFMATRDEIADPHALRLWLKVNGETLQDSNTNDLIFNIPTIVSYLSQFMTLLPGDVISTGTPAGVGLGFKPPRYLKPGDVVELGIDGLGTSSQHAVAYPGTPSA